ncbi:MAG: hypothetical protein AAF798_08735 [Bacteroidota bacterium]
MDVIGLIVELLFLGLGVYIYLYSRGFFKSKDAAVQKKSDDFRKQNGWWLRLLALGLIAVMSLNLVLHLQDLFNR